MSKDHGFLYAAVGCNCSSGFIFDVLSVYVFVCQMCDVAFCSVVVSSVFSATSTSAER